MCLFGEKISEREDRNRRDNKRYQEVSDIHSKRFWLPTRDCSCALRKLASLDISIAATIKAKIKAKADFYAWGSSP
jgi:hypothetical protein